MDGTRAGGACHGLLFILKAALPRSTAAWALLLLLAAPGSGQIRPIELEGFIVTGTPVPRAAGTVASHVTVLDGEELRRRGVTRVADALAGISGLVVVQNGSYGSLTSTYFRGGRKRSCEDSGGRWGDEPGRRKLRPGGFACL